MMNDKDSSSVLLDRSISAQDFRSFGLQQLAYVREMDLSGKKAWAIHAADGTQLTLIDSKDMAMALVRHNDLEAVAIH